MTDQIQDSSLALFLRLLIAHFISDFIIQRKSWIQEKNHSHWRAPGMYFHLFWVGVLTYLLSGYYSNFLLPLIVIVTHFFTDLIKSYFPDKPSAFFSDQLVHLIVLVLVVHLYFVSGSEFNQNLPQFFTDISILGVIAGYIFVIWPSSFMVAQITRPWHRQVELESGLTDAGKWIGMLERILVLTFVLINQYVGIGFLITAKSILRFNDIRQSESRKEAEYILIGTMISFMIAIFTGIVIQLWLMR